jgi:hypothetical protein
MTSLPLARYTGEETECATDVHGRHFWAYQGPNNTGVVIMEDHGACTVLPYECTGRPSIECNPLAGLWLIGNQEAAPNETPPRIHVAEYVPWPMPAAAAQRPIVVAASSPLWQLWRGTKQLPDGTRQPYDASDFDTDAEDAQRVGKQLAALNALIDTLVAAGIVVKG